MANNDNERELDAAERAELEYNRQIADEREQLRRLRVRAAVLIRSGTRKGGLPLNDLQICRRVVGITPAEVAAVRREVEQFGVLADELENGAEGQGGWQ